MLSIAAVSSSAKAGHYFSQDNYYAKDSQDAKEASEWWGKGAEVLSLKGPVDTQQFIRLLEGQLPHGATLGVIKEGKRHHRPGYDLTFSAPKSVSLLALLGRDERLVSAHQQAVTSTLTLIEEELASARITEKGETRYESTGNLVGALFLHDTSRAFDPQLHTHAVMMNMTQRQDGQFRALATQSKHHVKKDGLLGFSEQLYHRKLHFGAVYRAELAKSVKALGYDIVQTHRDGRFEIKGVSEAAIKQFSSRRQDIEAAMKARDMHTSKQADLATLMTREAKKTLNRDDLHQFWAQKSAQVDLKLDSLVTEAKQHAATRDVLSQEAVATLARDAVDYAGKHLAEREAVFTHDDVFNTAKNYSLGDINYRDMIEAIHDAYQGGRLLDAGRADGQRLATTQKALDIETRNITMMQAGKASLSPLMSPAVAEMQIMYRSLTQGQMDAAKLILTTSDSVVGIQGYAGTGKTTMLSTVKAVLSSVKEVSSQLDVEIKGIAPTKAAANKLGEELGINGQTLEQFLINQENRLALGETQQKEIWLLDESSMVSSRNFNALLKAQQQAQSRLVIIGDKQQLASVEAGKPFEQMQKAGMAFVKMLDIIRQKKGSQLFNSVHDVIKGDVAHALSRLGDNIQTYDNKDERLAALSEHYLRLSASERADTLVITPANKDREKVNEAIRQGLQHEGTLAHDGLKTRTLTNVGLTQVEKSRAQNYKPGMWVRFNQASEPLGIQRGEYYSIDGHEQSSNTLHITDREGRTISWQPHKFAGSRRGAVEVFEPAKRALAVGDKIRWTKNFVKEERNNAERAHVLNIKEHQVQFQLANGKNVWLDMQDHKNQHWDHAYASTAYNAQGLTVKRVIAHDESFRKKLTNQRAFYVIISRAKEAAYLYVDDKAKYLEQLEQVVGDKTSALEALSAKTTEPQKSSSISANVTLTEPNAPLETARAIEQTLGPNPAKIHREPHYDIDHLSAKLHEQAEHVVERLLGEPNKKLSSQQRWHYGKKGSLSITMQGEKRGLWYSFEDGVGGNLLQLIQREMALGFKEILPVASQLVGYRPLETSPALPSPKPEKKMPEGPTPDDEKAIKTAQKIWQKTVPIEGTLGERYLREHRGITLSQLPKTYRFMTNYFHPLEKKQYPALVVAARNQQGVVQAVQAICLDRKTANKATLDVVKLTHGRARFGATVKLNTSDNKTLYAAEGPETALSILNANPQESVITTLSSGNFKHIMPLHEQQNQLVICGDNDHGEKALREKLTPMMSTLKERFNDIHVVLPEKKGQDFNDVHRQNGLSAVTKQLRLSMQTLMYSEANRLSSQSKTEGKSNSLLMLLSSESERSSLPIVSQHDQKYFSDSPQMEQLATHQHDNINDLSGIER